MFLIFIAIVRGALIVTSLWLYIHRAETKDCTQGSYGLNCTFVCGQCQGQCDSKNGTCVNGCATGWTGHRCETEIKGDEDTKGIIGGVVAGVVVVVIVIIIAIALYRKRAQRFASQKGLKDRKQTQNKQRKNDIQEKPRKWIVPPEERDGVCLPSVPINITDYLDADNDEPTESPTTSRDMCAPQSRTHELLNISHPSYPK